MQAQMQLRRLVVQNADRLGNARLRIAHGLVEQRHVQRAGQPAMDVVHLAQEAFHATEQLQGGLVDAMAFGREREARAPAPAQRQAQALLQVLHMAAQRGAADVQLQLGSRHAAALDHGLEHAQQAQVHVAQLAQRGARTPVPRRAAWGAVHRKIRHRPSPPGARLNRPPLQGSHYRRAPGRQRPWIPTMRALRARTGKPLLTCRNPQVNLDITHFEKSKGTITMGRFLYFFPGPRRSP